MISPQRKLRSDSERVKLSDPLARVKSAFAAHFGHDRCRIARAPGRVNLIGEHTDYNDGYVFPVAIDRYVSVAFAARSDDTNSFRGYSLDYDEERVASFDELAPRRGPPTWFDYVAGVAWALLHDGVPLRGLDFVVLGDVPIGAGLSSSAAIELAMARAFLDVSGVAWDGEQAALAGQRAENDYIGVNSGIMDQMASALSQAGTAMLLDCRDLSFRAVSIPESLLVVVMDTGTRRALAGSAYNERRASCERVTKLIGDGGANVRALRDVTEADLEASRGRFDATDYRRALHVVHENARTLEMARALEAEDTATIKELMARSHASLRDLYEVSSPELDRVVSIASSHPACHGARMTGAGFGGCAVALVSSHLGAPHELDEFCDHLRRSYSAGEIYVCHTVGGAHLIDA